MNKYAYNPRPYELHDLAMKRIRPGSIVLDCGRASGYLGHILINRGCTLIGIDKDLKSVRKAYKYYKHVILGDLEQPQLLKVEHKYFNYILALDVIEHLREPSYFLKFIKHWMKQDGMLLLSTPNIAHISIRIKLLCGQFEYTDVGILDRTHTHFYTKKSLLQYVKSMGYKNIKIDCSADFGQIPYIGKIMRNIPKRLQYVCTKLWPTLLTTQWLLEAHI